MDQIRVIGVPEHFNYPWQLALDDGAFAKQGIDLQWTDIPEGSGRMSKMLADGEADLAIILTDGLLKAVADGLDAKIVQLYVASPLLWGIHVGSDSPYKSLEDLRGTKAAISRFGSGSHLMAYVNASQQDWSEADLQFEVVNTLDGAVSALTDATADYFLWERFTTQPLVDQQIFRRIGVCPTPWPCFVIAGRSEFLDGNRPLVQSVLRIINTYTEEFLEIPSIDRTLSNTYGQELEAIREWMKLTSWSQQQISTAALQQAIAILDQLNLLKKRLSPEDLLA
ncbi:substrate-binding domain-containing protein [Robiginitalea myxolifaciens]|uniref:substrate-binding domain-containing protein n=1 Tax=Robiginitalea myxolifaciens TaxID=400055 RepID=UPI000B881EB9|nr:substrate-binding domain-containing protein [Robiginitalea myxolifaciens]